MAITNTQVEKLLTGHHVFSYLNFSMLIVRMKMLYMKNPSPDTLSNCAKEITGFLEKFKTGMGADYALIEKL
ncbi:MAG: hypothetical protein LBH25_02990 [Fibromonadaceae bacterium]|jgi:hypothetical protein|nr:hypothetical protein [Fibromonadaceae bacterium]